MPDIEEHLKKIERGEDISQHYKEMSELIKQVSKGKKDIDDVPYANEHCRIRLNPTADELKEDMAYFSNIA